MIAPQLPYAVSLPCTCGSQSVITKPLYPIPNDIYCTYGYSTYVDSPHRGNAVPERLMYTICMYTYLTCNM